MRSDGFVINNDMRRSSHSNSSCSNLCPFQMLRVLKDFERLEVYDHCKQNNMMFSVTLWFYDLMITASAESLVLRVPERHSAEYLFVTSALVRITCTGLWAARRNGESRVAAANRVSSQEHIRNFFVSERLRVRFLTGRRLEASYSALC